MTFRLTSRYKLHSTNELLGLLGLDSKDQLQELLDNKENFFQEKTIKNFRWDGTPKRPRIGWVPRRKMRYVHDRLADSILKELQAQLPDGIMGGRPGSTTKKMATLHCNKEAVLKMDIQKCFDSISPEMVRRMLHKGLNTHCSPENLDIIATLLTMDGRLPQGAPGSTAICNCVLLPVFSSIDEYCKSHGLVLTSWVDDFVISGPKSAVYNCIPKLSYLFKKNGFKIGEEKTKVEKKGEFGKKDRDGHVTEVVGMILGLRPTIHKAKREFIRNQWRKAANGDKNISLKQLQGKTEYIKPHHPGFVKRLKKLEAQAKQKLQEVL